MKLYESRRRDPGADPWEVRQSVARSVPRFAGLVVVNLGLPDYTPPG
jgi:hypothetical protein